MKVQIIFGSYSDETVYGKLESHLVTNDFVTDTKVLSAHRNPHELKALLSDLAPQPIVAGAGLAAHLPGVIASLVNYPVFGIPVKSQFRGLDAFLSIVQMPKGVPVACTFSFASLSDFLQRFNFEEKIYSDLTDDTNAELQEASILVSDLEGHANKKFDGIRVLWLNDEEKQDPNLTLSWHKMAEKGGLWVGINRLENAKIFLEKMRGIYELPST